MAQIAPTATVHPQARIAEDVEIGPGCYVGPEVQIGRGCRLIANVTVIGRTKMGEHNICYPAVVLGAAPQDLKYKGGETRLDIGDHNIFRENVTAHLGTELGGGVTEIGSHNQLQVGSHIAHDVRLGHHCILSNQVQIAGHVQIEDHVTIGGLAGVQQFVTLGSYCFITGAARCTADTPPYVIFGHDGVIQGVNVKGLARWGFSEVTVQQLRELCRVLFPRRHQPPTQHRIRNLYGLIGPRRADTTTVATLAKRLREADARAFSDEHCQNLLSFVKRSIQSGVHGRYLESRRRDSGSPPPDFYRRAVEADAGHGGNGQIQGAAANR